jgi:hypothetical protein
LLRSCFISADFRETVVCPRLLALRTLYRPANLEDVFLKLTGSKLRD